VNIVIKKRHNEYVEITEDGKGLSVKSLIIEAKAYDIKDELKVILTYSNDTVKTLTNSVDNIILDMTFGGGYELMTYGQEDEIKKRITLYYGEMLLSRIQWFRYELDTKITYGKMKIEIALT